MKKIIAVLLLGTASAAFACGQIKEICRDRIDAKTGKTVIGNDGNVVKDCKKIKVHKKLDGKPVPETK